MRIDLDLLPILYTLLSERSVSRAAAKLNRTQPAVSYALSKLRDQLGDPLLVKSGNTMKPTPRALALEIPLREALAALQSAVLDTATFDRARTTGEIHVGVEEYSGFVIVPPLLKRLLAAAPGLRVLVYRIGMTQAEAVEAGHAFDFVFSRLPSVPLPFHRDVVLVDTTLLVAPRDHPIFAGPITLDSYLSFPHMVPTWQHSVAKTFIDEYVERKGRKRNVRVGMPPGMHMMLTSILGDVLTAIPGRFGRMFADSTATKIAKLPFDVPPLEVSIVWHEKHRHEGRHIWLRGIVKSVCTEIAALPLIGFDDVATPKRRRKAQRKSN